MTTSLLQVLNLLNILHLLLSRNKTINTGFWPQELCFSDYRDSIHSTKDAIHLVRNGLPTDDVVEIDVRRKFVLQDALREGRKKKFSPKKLIKVCL